MSLPVFQSQNISDNNSPSVYFVPIMLQTNGPERHLQQLFNNSLAADAIAPTIFQQTLCNSQIEFTAPYSMHFNNTSTAGFTAWNTILQQIQTSHNSSTDFITPTMPQQQIQSIPNPSTHVNQADVFEEVELVHDLSQASGLSNYLQDDPEPIFQGNIVIG